MSLSRSESRGRLRSIALGQWIVVLILLLAAIVAAFVLYVRSADADYRNEKNRAVALAFEQGGLVKVDSANSYTWEESMWIVQGTDSEGEAWMLWERSEGLVKEKLSDSYSQERMLAQFGIQRPSAVPVRIQPGWFGNQPVWEIRYRQAPDSDRQSIDFYAFKEGTLIKKYDLPGR